MGSGNFVEPPGVGDLIGGLLENQILIGITDASNGQMSIRGAISVENSSEQDFCTETLNSFPAADFSGSPYFEIPEGDVQLSVAGLDIMINSMSISGTFASDGSYMGGASVRGELDARDIGPLLEGTLESTDPSEICTLLVGFGVQCIECSSDSEPYCISLYVNRLTAENTNTTLGLVCESDCHESCGDSTCETPQAADAQECIE